MDGRRRVVPKVAQKKGRKPAAKRKSRVARRQNVGALQSLGARLDSSAGVLAAGAANLLFLAILVGGLAALALSAFSGSLRNLPERIAMLPEDVSRGLGFNVMRVTVKGGDELSTRDIMNALRDPTHGSVIGRSLLAVDAEDLRARIEALGPVHAAAVQKLFPDTIHVSIIERQPRALYQNPDGTFSVVDAAGEVISKADATEHTNLPVISGTLDPSEAMPFLHELRRRPVLFARTAGIEVIGGRRVDIRFRNGFLAKLPETDVALALRRLEQLEAGTGSLAATLDYIDLRDPKWAYYKPKES